MTGAYIIYVYTIPHQWYGEGHRVPTRRNLDSSRLEMDDSLIDVELFDLYLP